MKYAVRRISLAPLAKFGCLLGTLISLLPSLLCDWSASSVAIGRLARERN